MHNKLDIYVFISGYIKYYNHRRDADKLLISISNLTSIIFNLQTTSFNKCHNIEVEIDKHQI
jgi:hypothetical protein